jgi:hypothetical protein
MKRRLDVEFHLSWTQRTDRGQKRVTHKGGRSKGKTSAVTVFRVHGANRKRVRNVETDQFLILTYLFSGFAYDALNRPTNMVDAVGTSVYTYTRAGFCARKTARSPVIITHALT